MQAVNNPIPGLSGCRNGWLLATLLVPLLWSGCLAQKADLTRVSQELDRKIVKLDEAIKRANEAEAKLGQDVSELRGDEVAALRGELEKHAHDLGTLGKRLDDVEQASKNQAAAQKADRERLQQQLEKLNASLDTLSAGVLSTTKALEVRLQEQDAQKQALGEQVVQLGRALAEFKLTISGLGEKLIQEDQRINDFTTEISRRTDALTDKVDTDAKTTTAHLAEVNKSVASVAKALEAVGGNFVAQEEQQDRRLDEMIKDLHAVSSQMAALTQAVNQQQEARGAAGGKHGHKKAAQAPQAPTETKEHRGVKRSDQQGHDPAPPAGDAVASAAPASVAVVSGEPAKGAGSESGQADAPAGAQAAAPVSAKEAYERYMQKFKQGDLSGALQGFSDFLTQYPTSDLAPNAQYWQGECYYGKKEYERAIEAFDRVKLAYPTSEKVPAALLKKGFAYLALKDRGRASSALRQVVDAYPKSPEAGKALDKLAQLKQTR